MLAGLVFLFGNCFAFTSIATIEGNVLDAWWRANNYEIQKDADEAALDGCRVQARKNGIGHIAKKCKIVTRAKTPGYGAVTCGENGCSWGYGYESGQAAADAAYANCEKSYKNCRDKDIEFWEDFAGFKEAKREKVSSGDCRPRTATLRCQSSCTNGDCTVVYENGCKMRVQVSPRFDGIQNQWVYPSPSC